MLILDCDVHLGRRHGWILAEGPELFTCSLHCRANYPARKATSDLDIEIEKGADDVAYLGILDDTLHRLQRLVTFRLVIYDAGVDVHRGRRSATAAGARAMTASGSATRWRCSHYRGARHPGGDGDRRRLRRRNAGEVAFRHSLVFHAAAADC